MVIVVGLAAVAGALVWLVGPWGLLAGGVLLCAFGAVGIEVDDE